MAQAGTSNGTRAVAPLSIESEDNSIEIAVVGAGYVGLATAVMLAHWGHKVQCFDRDEEKVRALAAGGCPIMEPRLPQLLLEQMVAGRLSFSTRIDVARSRIVFLCVGTPPDEDGGASLSDLFDAVDEVGRTMQPGIAIVVKSTVPVGTCDLVEDRLSRCVDRGSFSVLSNPEFLRQGFIVDDTERPDRIVIGAEHHADAVLLGRLYEATGAPQFVFDRHTAELSKYAANAFLASRVSLMNELASIADHVGADVTQVAQAVGMDPRIGKHFLKAGIGYGGSCLPKDVSALRHFAGEANCSTPLLDAVADVNQKQHEHFVARIEAALGGLAGKKIGLLGLAFKQQTSDIRGSRALALAGSLEERGAQLQVYDPMAMAAVSGKLSEGAFLAEDAYAACSGTDAIVIATEWPEFASLDWPRIKEMVREPYVFDGRNLLDPARMRASGFFYYGIGRSGPGARTPAPVLDHGPKTAVHDVMAPPPPRFLLYSHDALGMGHARRNLAVAAGLLKVNPGASILLATGMDDVGLLGVPPQVEVLKLPALRKIANGHYVARHLDLPADRVIARRSELLRDAVDTFRPNVLLADQHPLGVGGELQDALATLKAQGGKAVLGLRDILDSPETVTAEWTARRLDEQIVANYQRVLVYGHQEIFDPVGQYLFSPSLAQMTRFCGYVTHLAGPESRNSQQPRRVERPTVLATVGGGEDGYEMLDLFMEASEGMPWRGIVVAGPYAPAEKLAALRRRAQAAGVQFHSQVDGLADWFSEVDALVCMGGYNSLIEAVRSGTPAVCLPRTDPRTEQLIRAQAFTTLGLIRHIDPAHVDVKVLRAKVRAALSTRRADLSRRAALLIDFDGAAHAATQIYSLIQQAPELAVPQREVAHAGI